MGRSTPAEFYPPLPNPFLLGIARTIASTYLSWFKQIKLDIPPEVLQQLQTLEGQRLLILPNHPTFDDPIVVFALTSRLKGSFYFLAAYEQFAGLLGWVFQRLAAYSIRRGIADRASIAQTLELLTQPNCRLVIFPEGGCSFQNDTVMPFRGGAMQMAFQALNRLARQGEPVPDLYVIPLAVKYFYIGNMAPVIQRSLHHLATELGLKQTGTEYDQLRAISEQMLTNLEQEYHLQSPEREQWSWNDRINALKLEVIQACETSLGMTSALNEPIRERVYRIQYALKTQDDLESVLEGQSTWDADKIYRATIRLLNFDAIYDGYVADHPSPERFLDTLTRLEREVFHIDQPAPKGHRLARVEAGVPINLREYFPEYQKNRAVTINQLTLMAQQSVQQGLDQMNAKLKQTG
ncbi:MAG: 1-acyl-sn-glycerol-3-phosphate acyltransferase [Leptolyngbyaceae cyanobacterium]